MATPSATLLKRHLPLLKYDSQEAYFADAAATFTDNPGNLLRNAAGKTIAKAGQGLALATLAAKYPDGTAAVTTDVLSDPKGDYRAQARALHAKPEYANQVYGYAVRDSAGDLWLQYWFFYFYNDFNLIGDFIKAGLHEGDWEMIQIRLRAEQPDRAIFAQHDGAEPRDWRQVDRVPGTQRPIVYVARGSHASYFEPGTHWTGVWFDNADGKRRSPELRLNVVQDGKPEWAWVRWPGSWGDTKKGSNPIGSNSPRGPGPHSQWDDPLVLVEKAESRSVVAGPPPPRPIPPPAPNVSAAWDGRRIAVTYEMPEPAAGRRATGLVVTLNSPDELLAPTYETFAVRARRGTVTLETKVKRTNRYDLYASAATKDGLASESVRVDLLPAARAR